MVVSPNIHLYMVVWGSRSYIKEMSVRVATEFSGAIRHDKFHEQVLQVLEAKWHFATSLKVVYSLHM